MKKCSDCNTIMIEDTDLHTDYVGGVSFEEQIYLTYRDEENGTKSLIGDKKISTRRVCGRVCPNCGKVELYVDLKKNTNNC